MTISPHEQNFSLEKINQETAKIKWADLQRFFAAGQTIYIAPELDLINTAQHIASDNKTIIEQAMGKKSIHPVTDDQAKEWLANDITTWTVVVKPWLLVQPINHKND